MSEFSGVGKHLSLEIRCSHPLQGWQAFAIGIAHGGRCRSPVAQLVEQAAVNRWVAGSSPARGASTRTEADNLPDLSPSSSKGGAGAVRHSTSAGDTTGAQFARLFSANIIDRR